MPNIRYELIYELSGFSEIYTADWIDGYYEEWDFKNQQLVRNGTQEVILKRLDDAESINRTWFEEAKSHLTIGNKWNATEEEQEVFYSKSYGFKIPDNINEFNKSDIQNVDISIKVNSKKLSNKIFEMSQVNLNYDIRDYYKKEAIQQIQQIKRANININDENEIYNNPNLHSKEQNILEIPDELF
ncbi:uncharacterized protein OCT59_003715 [Rhizophagus irregularis]|uniref:uncharacterized protein n=1 Tax=Rhizophagus irregularis TaxID=588596 RepID=UPI00331B7D2B|nr:hypothetical protein OCT59_003715 [Rhizophagus irregularis]